MKAPLILLAVLLGMLLLATSIVFVDETEHVIVTQFGRPTAVISEAGPRLKLPAPLQRVIRLDRRALLTEVREVELLTADKKNVLVSSYLSWRIVDPLAYYSALRSREFAEARLVALVQSELGSALGDLPFARLVPAAAEGEGLDLYEEPVREACRVVAQRDFGIEVVSFGVTRLNFPPQNLQSVFARMRAERERIARGHRSEGRAQAQAIRAEADRERAELLAGAEAAASRLRGQGEAEAARIYADAQRDHEEFYTFLRTLESYEKVLDGKTTLVLPADSPYLSLLVSDVPSARGGKP